MSGAVHRCFSGYSSNKSVSATPPSTKTPTCIICERERLVHELPQRTKASIANYLHRCSSRDSITQQQADELLQSISKSQVSLKKKINKLDKIIQTLASLHLETTVPNSHEMFLKNCKDQFTRPYDSPFVDRIPSPSQQLIMKKLHLFSLSDQAWSWIKMPLAIIENSLWASLKFHLPQQTEYLIEKTLQEIPREIKNELGKGSFGHVQAVQFGKETYAWKKYHYDKNSPDAQYLEETAELQLQREACAYMVIPPHDHIVSLLGINSGGLYLEKMSGGTLKKKITDPTITSKEFINYCLHVASALSHLHTHGFTYKDLKPENVLVDDSSKTAKLCDLGLITITSHDQDNGGSFLFRAPEIYSGRYITTKADSWSFGVMLYKLLTGRAPFRRHTNSQGTVIETVDEFEKRKVETLWMNPCPESIFLTLDKNTSNRWTQLQGSKELLTKLQNLIKGCLHGDPEKRLSMKQIRDTLAQCQARS